jgi:hypothetical protein
MISSILQGGLGNQLFQVAAAASLAKDINTISIFNTSLHILNLQGNKAISYSNNVFSRINLIKNEYPLTNLEIYEEQKYSYTQLPRKDNLLLKGYFQTQKYFLHNSEYIRDLFIETEEVESYIKNKYQNIDFDKSISMHIRRGDYLRFPNIHPVCNVDYYNNSLKLLGEYDKLLIFSDDIDWCKNNLKYDKMYFVESEPDYIDFYLISRCKDNIIANSSFSWWAAWNNRNNSKRVIYPNTWFGPSGPPDTQDLFPEEWIKCC